MKLRMTTVLAAVLVSTRLAGTPKATEGKNMTSLDGLTWKPKWVSHLGCLKGCLDYLKVNVSDDWLFGASGHAFVLNIHEELCPSGPTAWKTQRMTELAQNVGCRLEIIAEHKSQDGFRKAQQQTWDKVRAALAKGTPCYGWELGIPEFYVVHGHDDAGYLYKGPGADEGKGPLPWQKLGDTGIGWLEMVIVRKAEPASDKDTVGAAIRFAVAYGRNPAKWTHGNYRGGLAAYDLWIEALEKNKADGLGAAYNAAVWAQCRGHAAGFLRKAKGRMAKRLSPFFDQAIAHYEAVAAHLATVADTFPFTGVPDEQRTQNAKDGTKCKTAIAALRAAKAAEEKGLAALESVLEGM